MTTYRIRLQFTPRPEAEADGAKPFMGLEEHTGPPAEVWQAVEACLSAAERNHGTRYVVTATVHPAPEPEPEQLSLDLGEPE